MVADNLTQIKTTLPEGVTLVAVSKFHPAEAVREAYDAGQRVFGESREKELQEKYALLPHDIEWHFIGHLQTNKVKYIAPFVSVIQSVDSERLIDEIEKQAAKHNRVIDILLQVHIAQEESKWGFLPTELAELLSGVRFAERWPHVRPVGMMTMATQTDDEEQIRAEFRRFVALQRSLLEGPLAAQGITREQMHILSFGMSGDYQIAIQEGSNMVRIGTAIFGDRQY